MGQAGVIKDLRTFSVAVNAALKTALHGNSGDITSQFTTEINVKTKEIEFPIAGSTGPMREWKGSRIVTSIMRDSYRITTKKFEKTISLSVEDEEDDNLDIYMPAINTVAQSIANWKAREVHKAIEANGAGYDGVPFFSTSHPEQGANVANYQAGAEPAWYLIDPSRPVSPWIWAVRVRPVMKAKTSDSDDNVFWRDEYVWGARSRGGAGYGLWQSAFKSKAELNATNFEDAMTAMRARKDEWGESLDINPAFLLIPPQLEWDAKRLFGRATTEDGAENIHQGGIRVVVDNRLTGA